MGDVWSVDSCGNLEEKVEECGAQLCREDSCEANSGEPCSEPPEGRCAGDVVHLCVAGEPARIDCRAKGMRCGYGIEGAECLPEIPIALHCMGGPRCEGDVLVSCVDGREQRTECPGLSAKCMRLPGALFPGCVEVKPYDRVSAGCGPCGCPGQRKRAESLCDGRDEDGDGLLDEGLACGAVPLLAFIVTDAAGHSSYEREDVEAELAEINRAFASSAIDGALSFVLDDVRFLAAPELLELDGEAFERLANDPRVHPARQAFYVPLVFTDAIVAGGEAPKPGISTLPNGTCGGMQQGSGPEIGLIALAKARFPTTAAHELGHFFGLCHTHDRQEAAPFVAYADVQTGRIESCRAACRGEGDGVCDTPFDPGPDVCTYDPGCNTACGASADPDPTNLMGYYAGCRQRFSDEQMQLMQHTLALRRGWHACLDGACSCDLGGAPCPTGMSCRPGGDGEQGGRCGLDGPRAPGATCQSLSDCGQGAICVADLQGRASCARPCLRSTADCNCVTVTEGLSICLQDLSAR